MRQAGRSLPGYREIRKRHGLFEVCRSPELCAQVTLEPVEAHGVDAAVMFADIMLPVLGMGVEVELVENVGPVVEHPVESMEQVERLRVPEPAEALPFVLEAVRLVRSELAPDRALVGFCGGPFTVAGYLVEAMVLAGGDVIGLDWRLPLGEAWERVGYDRGVQGNLDPALLLGPFPRAQAAAERILADAEGRPGHVFNLGHGVLPDTDPADLRRLVELVHERTASVAA